MIEKATAATAWLSRTNTQESSSREFKPGPAAAARGRGRRNGIKTLWKRSRACLCGECTTISRAMHRVPVAMIAPARGQPPRRNPGGAMNPAQSFDYVVIGGGSAGCVLASRLTEDPSVSVALLEAGEPDRSVLIHCPAGFAAIPKVRPQLNWAFETVPQPGLNGRKGYQPRGRALGGSSAINAMIYIRGHRSDYDHWAALGNPGWSFAEVLPYFKKSENQERGASEWHGAGGPMNVADLRCVNPLSDRFIEACMQTGIPFNEDFNGAEQEGAGIFQVTQKNGRRQSAADA